MDQSILASQKKYQQFVTDIIEIEIRFESWFANADMLVNDLFIASDIRNDLRRDHQFPEIIHRECTRVKEKYSEHSF